MAEAAALQVGFSSAQAACILRIAAAAAQGAIAVAVVALTVALVGLTGIEAAAAEQVYVTPAQPLPVIVAVPAVLRAADKAVVRALLEVTLTRPEPEAVAVAVPLVVPMALIPGAGAVAVGAA
jgi:hypothetical protein